MTGHDAGVRLAATLDLPGGVLRLGSTAGCVHRLPPEDEVVAALTDAQPERAHQLVVDGRSLAHAGRAARVRAGLVVLDTPHVAPDVAVRDHLAAVTGARRAEALLRVLPQLAARGRELAGVLSGGERRLLGWLTAIALEPRVVVLDRAGTGLDDPHLRWAHGVIDTFARDGAVVLVRVGRDAEERWITRSASGTPR